MAKDTIKVNMNIYDIPIVVELLKKLEQENKQLKEEIARLKEIIYKARKMIFDNYGVLDKYEIELLDDVLKGDKENEKERLELMKTTIYDLLGMIKDGKAPKKFLWKDEVFGLSEDNKNYIDEDGDWLFIDYEWLDMLNNEIKILETTITYKPDKIEKLNLRMNMNTNFMEQIENKINEIIDRLNKDQV